MTDFVMHDIILDRECDAIARDILDEFKFENSDDPDWTPDADEMDERVWERVDSHEWVIYNYKALQVCANCNTDSGEEFLDDVGFEWKQGESTIYTVATQIVFGEMRARVETALRELVDELESEAA